MAPVESATTPCNAADAGGVGVDVLQAKVRTVEPRKKKETADNERKRMKHFSWAIAKSNVQYEAKR